MKNIIILVFLVSLHLFISCSDNNNMNSYYNNPCYTKLPYTDQMAIDVALIDEYLSEEGIIAEIDESGLRYVIIEEGEGSRPVAGSTISVKYRGTLLSDNSLFDENTEGIELRLSLVIAGWQIGIPLIREGGKIMLYIPSLLGYGCGGSGSSIPSNANLIFEVEIIEII